MSETNNSGSFDDIKFVEELFAEYEKDYKDTLPGQIYPSWLTDQQLQWILKTAKNLKTK